MKLCAIVITYYPNIDEVKSNIYKYITHVDHLIIWNNTPSSDLKKHEIRLPAYADKVTFMSTGKNEGIGYAINRAIEYSIENNYTHLLTMDQDSEWDNFEDFLTEANNKSHEYYIIAPNINNLYPRQKLYLEISSITSGTIYNLSIIKKIGPFNERFFIDAVDEEFGFRAYSHGYPTAILGLVNLKQKFGVQKNFFSKQITEYNAFRTYYIVRNHLWIWRLYPSLRSFHLFKVFIFDKTIKRVVTILLAEDNKRKKLLALLKGIKHGLFKSISE